MVVFKTKGNYLRERMRCVFVSSGGIVFILVAFLLLVLMIMRCTHFVT